METDRVANAEKTIYKNIVMYLEELGSSKTHFL